MGQQLAPGTSHAITAVVREAKLAKEEGRQKAILLLNWSGHGLMDLTGYDAYLSGKLTHYVMTPEEMAKSLKSVEGRPPKPPAL